MWELLLWERELVEDQSMWELLWPEVLLPLVTAEELLPSRVQVLLQPSPLTVLPSSHCSGRTTSPSPQMGLQTGGTTHFCAMQASQERREDTEEVVVLVVEEVVVLVAVELAVDPMLLRVAVDPRELPPMEERPPPVDEVPPPDDDRVPPVPPPTEERVPLSVTQTGSHAVWRGS